MFLFALNYREVFWWGFFKNMKSKDHIYIFDFFLTHEGHEFSAN